MVLGFFTQLDLGGKAEGKTGLMVQPSLLSLFLGPHRSQVLVLFLENELKNGYINRITLISNRITLNIFPSLGRLGKFRVGLHFWG